MSCRTCKKQANSFVRAAFENQRPGVAPSAEWLCAQADNDDLIIKRRRASLVTHANISFNAGDAPHCEAGGAPKLVHDHINLRGSLSGWWANKQNRVGCQTCLVQLGDSAIHVIHTTAEQQWYKLGQ